MNPARHVPNWFPAADGFIAALSARSGDEGSDAAFSGRTDRRHSGIFPAGLRDEHRRSLRARQGQQLFLRRPFRRRRHRHLLPRPPRRLLGQMAALGPRPVAAGSRPAICSIALHGYVVDFLDFQAGHGGPHWPAFNVADSCICLAVARVFFWSSFWTSRAPRPPGRRSETVERFAFPSATSRALASVLMKSLARLAPHFPSSRSAFVPPLLPRSRPRRRRKAAVRPAAEASPPKQDCEEDRQVQEGRGGRKRRLSG